MTGTPTCPRCGSPLAEPGSDDGDWWCERHGEVDPLWPAYPPTREGLRTLLGLAVVPVWLPWPMPVGWTVTGFAGAGDPENGMKACAVALSGPGPVGGRSEMLLVSEEPGVGLGARFAGLPGPDPGERFAAGPPNAFVRYSHHDFPLWHVAAAQRAVYAGEMLGNWMWAVLWPDSAGVLLVETLALLDLRDPGQELDLPFGTASPRLPA